jgi:hypothetical protein
MTMLDILKERLPEGLTIAKVKDKSNASQIQIWFDYEEVKGVVSWLNKTCAPGCAERVCDATINAAMAGVGLKRKDQEMASYWLGKTMNME